MSAQTLQSLPLPAASVCFTFMTIGLGHWPLTAAALYFVRASHVPRVTPTLPLPTTHLTTYSLKNLTINFRADCRVPRSFESVWFTHFADVLPGVVQSSADAIFCRRPICAPRVAVCTLPAITSGRRSPTCTWRWVECDVVLAYCWTRPTKAYSLLVNYNNIRPHCRVNEKCEILITNGADNWLTVPPKRKPLPKKQPVRMNTVDFYSRV